MGYSRRPPKTAKPRRLDKAALWQYALKSLGGRAYSAGELRQKLLMKAEQPDDVASTLARLRECGYLDDKRFAENFAGARLETQGFGKTRVIRELRQKRVAPAVAERAVAEAYGSIDEIQLIESFLRRKYRHNGPDIALQDPKEFASAYRKLLYAGFSGGNCLRVLKRFAKNPELLDQLEPAEELMSDSGETL
jgi:regulatory protein